MQNKLLQPTPLWPSTFSAKVISMDLVNIWWKEMDVKIWDNEFDQKKITSTNPHYSVSFPVSAFSILYASVVAESDPRRTLATYVDALWAQFLHWKQWSSVVYRDVRPPH
jgi:hypothetical protein